MGFITPSTFYTQSSYKKLREIILEEIDISLIVKLPNKVFKKVIAESIITIFTYKKQKNCKAILYDAHRQISIIDENNCECVKTINTKEWGDTEDKIFSIFNEVEKKSLLKKIENGKPKLIDICDFALGVTPYDKYKGHTQQQIKNRIFHSEIKKDETFNPLLSGANINRYFIKWDGKEYISYGKWLGAPREARFFKEPRVLVRQIISGNPLRIYAGYTDEELYNTQIAFNILIKKNIDISIKYILAIINSKLMNFYHRNKFLDLSKTIFQKILIQDAKNFPIVIPDKQDKFRQCCEKIIEHVNIIIDLNVRLNSTNMERTSLQRQIDAVDGQIDRLVYQLYGLTEEEIKIVEEE